MQTPDFILQPIVFTLAYWAQGQDKPNNIFI